MPLVSLGAIPGSQLHKGLSDSWALLRLKLGDLEGRIASAERSLSALLNPQLDLGAIEAGYDLSPSQIFDIAADLPPSVDAKFSADIGALNLKLGQFSALAGNIDAALAIGGVQVWSYEGAASQFGPRLASATRAGFMDVTGETEVFGLVLASSSAANWAALSTALRTDYGSFSGDTTDANGQPTGELRSLGQVPGGTLLPTLSATSPILAAELTNIGAELAQLALDAIRSAVATFGVTPISLTAAIGAALVGAPSFALSPPSFTLQTDIGADLIVALGLRETLLPVTGAISVAINGGGVQAWSYTGALAGLGSEFQSAISGGVAGGLPNDRAHGLVLATNNEAAWAALGEVLRVT